MPPPGDKEWINIFAYVVKDGVKEEDIICREDFFYSSHGVGCFRMPVVYYYSTVVPAANPSSAVPDMANSPSSSRLPPDSSDENNDFLSEENINSGGKKKRTRGKTKVPVVAIGEKNRTMIEWNDYGQPVGKESDGFSTTVGFLVRENVPININTWHSVNQIIKERLCDLIMEKYAIENRHKKYILRLMGKLWRNWKSSLSRSIRKVVEDGVDISQHITSLKPNETSDREWDEFVKIRTSDKFKFPGEPSNGRALPSPSSRETRQESVTDSATTNLINAKCNLLNWTASGQVVAKAEIAATDSTSMVHHVILGPDCYKVWVKEVLVPDIILFRASKEFFTLNDAIGSTIAWPHKYISFEENQVNTNRLLSS